MWGEKQSKMYIVLAWKLCRSRAFLYPEMEDISSLQPGKKKNEWKEVSSGRDTYLVATNSEPVLLRRLCKQPSNHHNVQQPAVKDSHTSPI